MHTRETRAASIARQRTAATELDLLVLARQADALIGDVELLLEDARRLEHDAPHADQGASLGALWALWLAEHACGVADLDCSSSVGGVEASGTHPS